MQALRPPSRGHLVILLALVLLMYVALPQIGSFSDSLTELRRADAVLVCIGLGLVAVTYCLAAAVYCIVGLRRLPYGRTLAVQGATAFANRLLPAGLGGLSVNVQYLRRQRYTTTQAVSVAATVNLMGFLGHMLLLGMVVGAGADSMADLRWHMDLTVQHGVLAAGAAVVLVAVAVYWRTQVLRTVRTAWAYVAAYRQHPFRLVLALLCSMLITLLYVGVLYVCCRSVGADLALAQALVVSTVGVAAGAATPTPGGLGGLEAGLVAGCVAYGLAPPVALAAVLLYRLLTYWLPLIPGLGLFVLARKHFL